MYEDTDDPYEVIAEVIAENGAQLVGIDEQ